MKKYNNFLNEDLEFKIIPCKYNYQVKYNKGNKIDEFAFLSNKNNSYSVYFMLTEVDDGLLPNGKRLSDYTDVKKIPTIFFSLSIREFGDDFNDLTNKQEYLEVIGKVGYIIKNYMDENDYDVYTYDANEKKNIFFKYYWSLFGEFLMFNYPSKNYTETGKKEITYLIRNYGRFMFEYKYVKTSDTGRLKLPWWNED